MANAEVRLLHSVCLPDAIAVSCCERPCSLHVASIVPLYTTCTNSKSESPMSPARTAQPPPNHCISHIEAKITNTSRGCGKRLGDKFHGMVCDML